MNSLTSHKIVRNVNFTDRVFIDTLGLSSKGKLVFFSFLIKLFLFVTTKAAASH